MEKKIIIVEDDPFTQEFYKYLFSKTKHPSIVIEDGDKLMEVIQRDEAGLVIMDINLKNSYLKGEKVDGVILSQHIKKTEGIANVPILLVTAYQKNVGANNYFEDSLADDYIVKPILDYNDLLNKVNNLIAKN